MKLGRILAYSGICVMSSGICMENGLSAGMIFLGMSSIVAGLVEVVIDKYH